MTYKVPEGKYHPLDLLMRSIDETRNRKMIRLVDRLRTGDRMDHRADDDIRVQGDQIKGRGVSLHEFPRCLLRAFLGYIVSEHGILFLDRLLRGDLRSA